MSVRPVTDAERAPIPLGADGQVPTLPNRVFITGANGFIGRALMNRYQSLGVQVCGMDLHADEAREVVAGDIATPGEWMAHAKGCDLFIHTAAVVSLSAGWDDYRRISVRGVRNALDAAVAGGAQRFVHFSSIAALGHDYADGANEQTPVVIGEAYRYGVAKGASEHVVLAAHAAGEVACTIIRPGDVYGPGSRAWVLEPYTMAKKRRLMLPAWGEGIFTPVYIDDLLDGMVLAAGLEAGSGQVFILWGNEPVRCKDFFANHWQWAGRKGAPPSMPTGLALWLTGIVWRVNRALGIQDEAAPDTMLMFSRKGGYSPDKARRLLGYQPKVKLDEGLRRSHQWLKTIGVC